MTKRTKVHIAYGVMVALTVAAGVWVCLHHMMLEVWMHDSNYDLFSKVLTQEQRDAVIWSAKQMHSHAIFYFAVVSLMWIVGAWFLMRTGHDKNG